LYLKIIIISKIIGSKLRISNIDHMNIEYRSMESLRSVFIKLPEYIPSIFCGSIFCGSAVFNNSLTGTKYVKKVERSFGSLQSINTHAFIKVAKEFLSVTTQNLQLRD